MTGALTAVAVALLVGGAVILVAWPFLAPDRGAPEERLSDADRNRIDLLERRDAAYASLRDLEQDQRTGKLTDEDYEQERARLRAEAAEVLAALDALDADHLDSIDETVHREA